MDRSNNRPLTAASENGHLDIVGYLIKTESGVHGEEENALRTALSEERFDVARLLLENGSDIHAKKDSAIRWAAKVNSFEQIEFIFYQNPNYFSEFFQRDEELSSYPGLKAFADRYRLNQDQASLSQGKRRMKL